MIFSISSIDSYERWLSLVLLVGVTLHFHMIDVVHAAKPLDFASPLIQNSRVLSSAHSFERYDLDQSVLDERKYTQNKHAMSKKPHLIPKRQAYQSSLFATNASMIAVEFVCHPPPWAVEDHEKTCTKVQKAFQGVFQHVEEAFEFKRPIKVKFEYSSFCATELANHNGASHLASKNETTSATTTNSAHFRFNDHKKNHISKPAECGSTSALLGYAAPAAFWVPDVADPVTGLKYSYPQALVKQLLAESRNSINFNEFDIYARFNADQEDGLWYKDELPYKPIRSSQYDFQYIVLHEFMHGMGLVSSWNMPFDGYASTRGGTPGSAMLAPILVPENPNLPVPTPLATTIFDKYISTTSAVKQPAFFNAYASSIFKTVHALPSGATSGSFYKATLMDPESNQAAARAFQAATTARALQFSFPDGTSMLLHSEQGRYLSGTSIVHVNYDEYTGTTEFLMRPYANNGATLASLGHGQPFGPMTLKIFQTLGYTIQSRFSTNAQNAGNKASNWIRETSFKRNRSSASFSNASASQFSQTTRTTTFSSLIISCIFSFIYYFFM